jgi:bacillithiol biosynthesis cysteine-adding enzyme BshC
MECHCIPLRTLPHTSKLLVSFLEQFDQVASFYPHPPALAGALAAAKTAQIDAEIRRRVAEVLRDQNQCFGCDESVARSLDRLSSGAVAVVTGQQAGLLGGPAYSFYKALTAVHLAQQLTQAGVAAVPVFWIASEDHDLAEVNHCHLPGKEGLVRLELPATEADRGHRVGEVKLGQGIGELVAQAQELLQGPHFETVADALVEAYRPEETYGTAFARLFARLLRGRGLVLLDPLDRRLHELAAPVYRRAVVQNGTLIEELLARSTALERAGFHIQVKITETSTLLFINLDDQRTPLRQRNGKFLAGRTTFTTADLLARLGTDPAAFTGNVLLRPVVQDSLLPTAAYIAGPAEVAYFAQAEVVYRHLLGRMPAVLLRASFTLVPPQVERLLKRYNLLVEDVFAGRQQLRRQLEKRFLSKTLARQFDAGEKAIRQSLGKLREPLSQLDPTLAGALETAQKKILFQYEKLRAKAGRAANFRSGVLDRHERLLLDFLYPRHAIQERTISLLWFLALQGAGLLDELEHRAGNQVEHQILFL